MSTEAIALREADALPVWNPKQVVAQVHLIQQVMRDVMHKDEHYGTIPGTNKPTLLKPGAEKLCLTFRLAPTYEVVERDLGNGHREYRITCRLTSIQTGVVIGDGVGICSTMESKYRYRYAEAEDTGVPVPGKYWEAKKANEMAKAQELLGGKGYLAKKGKEGQWTIHKVAAAKTEHPDIADTYNTILKMAKKRAMVDAAITATGASDIFTQDLEEIVVEAVPPPPQPAPAPKSAETTQPYRYEPPPDAVVVEGVIPLPNMPPPQMPHDASIAAAAAWKADLEACEDRKALETVWTDLARKDVRATFTKEQFAQLLAVKDARKQALTP